MLGDDIMDEHSTVLAEMIEAHERTGAAAVVACKEFPLEEIAPTAAIAYEDAGDRLLKVTGIVEKPKPEDAPSDLGVMGRYVFTPGDLRRRSIAPSPAPAARSSSPTPSAGCCPTSTSTATPSTRAATTSAASSTTSAPPSSSPCAAGGPRPRVPRRGSAATSASKASADRRSLVLIPLEDAQAHVLERRARRCEPRAVSTVAAVGCVLAETVTSPEDVPPFANTAMDGYAVRAADVARRAGVARRAAVVAEVAAGHPARPSARRPGEAMRIMTGAPIPDGADAVVMVERTQRLDDGDARSPSRRPCRRARPCAAAGDDLRAGDVVFEPGEVLGAGHLGVLAGLGVGEVRGAPPAPGRRAVHRRRAGRGRAAARARPDPRLQPGHAARAGRAAGLAGRRPRARSATTRRPSTAAIRAGAVDLRRRAHQRRRVDGRHRPREGGARPHRRHALDADRHPAGQAVGLRAGRRHAGVRAARATRCRRW